MSNQADKDVQRIELSEPVGQGFQASAKALNPFGILVSSGQTVIMVYALTIISKPQKQVGPLENPLLLMHKKVTSRMICSHDKELLFSHSFSRRFGVVFSQRKTRDDHWQLLTQRAYATAGPRSRTLLVEGCSACPLAIGGRTSPGAYDSESFSCARTCAKGLRRECSLEILVNMLSRVSLIRASLMASRPLGLDPKALRTHKTRLLQPSLDSSSVSSTGSSLSWRAWSRVSAQETRHAATNRSPSWRLPLVLKIASIKAAILFTKFRMFSCYWLGGSVRQPTPYCLVRGAVLPLG